MKYIFKFLAAFFAIEIIFNIIEGSGLIELADYENWILILIIFEIEWRSQHDEFNIAFDFIHVNKIIRFTLSFSF